MLEETIARLRNAGIDGHEIAQALILTGAGLLAGSIIPKGAGHDLRHISAMFSQWIEAIADQTENPK